MSTFQTSDPECQELLTSVCEMGEADMASAVDIAQQAFSVWKAQPLEDQIALVLF